MVACAYAGKFATAEVSLDASDRVLAKVNCVVVHDSWRDTGVRQPHALDRGEHQFPANVCFTNWIYECACELQFECQRE